MYIKIVNNGRTTNLKVCIPPNSPSTIALTMPPTAYTNSLYVCSNTHKLTHFYYACLNYPVVSALIKAINAEWWPGLTTTCVCRHINTSFKCNMDQV